MTIRWITPLLGTAAASAVRDLPDIQIVDVRDLVDKAGNRPDVIREKIKQAVLSLSAGKRLVVCCDYGISRSNAVAAGILAMHESIPFETAVRRVLEATGEQEIKVDPLQAVRRALGDGRQNIHGKEQRILVTGGTGFLGKPVSKKLSETLTVVTPSRDELDLRQGSTRLGLIAGERGINCIVHLANPRVYTSNVALGDTLTMLRNVLEVCVAHDIKLIYLSNWEVYSGYRSSHLVADESLPLLPKGPYAETKYLCEILIEHWRRNQGLRCTMLRSSSVYGLGGDKPKFIYNFIDKLKQSKDIVTHRYNNSVPSLDLLYIDDLVAALSLAVGSDFSGDLNIGTGVITSTHKIAETLRNLLSGQSNIEETLIDDDTSCIAMDTGKAREVLGWQSTVDLIQGLQIILSNIETS